MKKAMLIVEFDDENPTRFKVDGAWTYGYYFRVANGRDKEITGWAPGTALIPDWALDQEDEVLQARIGDLYLDELKNDGKAAAANIIKSEPGRLKELARRLIRVFNRL